MKLLSMSLAAGLIILTTVVVRALAVNRFPKYTFLALWAVAAFRLLVPFTLPSPFSALLPLEVVHRVADMVSPAEAQSSAGAAIDQAWGGAQTAFSGMDAAQAAGPVGQAVASSVWMWLWLAGLAACALYFIASYLRGLLLFRESLPLENDEADLWLSGHQIRRGISLRRSDRVSVPLTYGVFHPVILLPASMSQMRGEPLRYVLTHEWVHIRRFDALFKLVLIAAVCVHWFNPLAWVMWALCNRDFELSCDERVLDVCGRSARRAYALTLIQMEERRKGMVPLCSCFSQSAIEERISSIMKTSQKSVVSILLAILLVLGVTAAFATNVIRPSAHGGADSAKASGARSTEFATREGGELRLSRESYEEVYQKYEPYGLSYRESDGRLYYQGRKVRHFEDMYPVDNNSQAGTVCSFPDGEVDVRALRDLSGPIERNADGSYDPSGILLGLEAYSQEEFDARTAQRNAARLTPGSGNDVQETGVAVYSTSAENQNEAGWWTAEEYEQWLEAEKEQLQALVGSGARSYTPSEGWFSWTQERVDEAIAGYEEILEKIRAGWRYYMDEITGLTQLTAPPETDSAQRDSEALPATVLLQVGGGSDTVEQNGGSF